MPYRGPQPPRIGTQFAQVQQYAGETGVWRQYISAATASGSGIWAGGGTTHYYREQAVTGLWGSPNRVLNARQVQLAGGQVMAGDGMISTEHPLGDQDEIVWRGVTYRVEGESLPVHLGGRVWYRTVLRRGDAG